MARDSIIMELFMAEEIAAIQATTRFVTLKLLEARNAASRSETFKDAVDV